MELEDVPDSEELALSALIPLHALKVPTAVLELQDHSSNVWRTSPCLEAGVVTDLHLLLLVHLARVDELLDRTCAEQAVDRHISCLAKAVRPVHCL